MTKTIAQLWNGHIEPAQQLGRNNSQMHELEGLMQRNFEKLEDILNGKDLDVLKNYDSCVTEHLILSCEQAFCDGFCLATKILVEALSGAEEVLDED